MKLRIVLVFGFIALFGVSMAYGYCDGVCGDVTGDGQVDISDLVAFVDCYANYTYPPPQHCLEYNWACGDVNNDGGTTMQDMYILIDYMFNGGSLDCGN